MPSFYDSYKPFRNYVRRFDLTSTLVDLWVYFRHLDDDAPLPPGYAVGASGLWHSSLKGQVFPWDLDTLTREVLLNAGSGGDRSLNQARHEPSRRGNDRTPSGGTSPAPVAAAYRHQPYDAGFQDLWHPRDRDNSSP
jgi:hypothetical protein